MLKSLTEIANFHATDKGTEGPSDSWSVHNYTDIYEPYLEHLRHKKINFLEIGLGVTGKNWDARIVQGRNTGGASIKMWFDYFTNASIYGIDINECKYLDNDRVSTFVVDQGDRKSLEAFIDDVNQIQFDAIVDDGSHIADHQQVSFSHFFKHLKPGGLYIIEDLLANGLDDTFKGRMASITSKSTRAVIREFARSGKFATPNALFDEDYLIDNIESIRFHCPNPLIKRVFIGRPTQPFKRVRAFIPNSEKVCVIRKKA